MWLWKTDLTSFLHWIPACMYDTPSLFTHGSSNINLVSNSYSFGGSSTKPLRMSGVAGEYLDDKMGSLTDHYSINEWLASTTVKRNKRLAVSLTISLLATKSGRFTIQ